MNVKTQIMTQFCVNENACIDIFEFNGAYYANVWIFDTTHRIGPSYDIALLNRDVINMLSDIRVVASVKASQAMGLKDLQGCLQNYKFEEHATA